MFHIEFAIRRMHLGLSWSKDGPCLKQNLRVLIHLLPILILIATAIRIVVVRVPMLTLTMGQILTVATADDDVRPLLREEEIGTGDALTPTRAHHPDETDSTLQPLHLHLDTAMMSELVNVTQAEATGVTSTALVVSLHLTVETIRPTDATATVDGRVPHRPPNHLLLAPLLLHARDTAAGVEANRVRPLHDEIAKGRGTEMDGVLATIMRRGAVTTRGIGEEVGMRNTIGVQMRGTGSAIVETREGSRVVKMLGITACIFKGL